MERFLNLPLRAKFILSFLAIICFGGVLTLTLGTRLEHKTIFSLAQAKVRHDLAAAWMVYHEKLNDIRDIILLNSSRESILKAIKENDKALLERHLSRVRREFNLDIFTLTDARGKVILRTTQAETAGGKESSKDHSLRLWGTEYYVQMELSKLSLQP